MDRPVFGKYGEKKPHAVYAEMGQDAIMTPGYIARGSNSWQEGIDEWGQVWHNGTYAGAWCTTMPT